jgi:ABC-type Fe3+ transport system substrate-binding protein
MVRLFALGMLLSLISPTEALAQKRIPKAQGHDQCPLGYVNTFGTTCVSPINYQMRPTNGEACDSGWMNVGAGY